MKKILVFSAKFQTWPNQEMTRIGNQRLKTKYRNQKCYISNDVNTCVFWIFRAIKIIEQLVGSFYDFFGKENGMALEDS
jgi:hypothetical protein